MKENDEIKIPLPTWFEIQVLPCCEEVRVIQDGRNDIVSSLRRRFALSRVLGTIAPGHEAVVARRLLSDYEPIAATSISSRRESDVILCLDLAVQGGSIRDSIRWLAEHARTALIVGGQHVGSASTVPQVESGTDPAALPIHLPGAWLAYICIMPPPAAGTTERWMAIYIKDGIEVKPVPASDAFDYRTMLERHQLALALRLRSANPRHASPKLLLPLQDLARHRYSDSSIEGEAYEGLPGNSRTFERLNGDAPDPPSLPFHAKQIETLTHSIAALSECNAQLCQWNIQAASDMERWAQAIESQSSRYEAAICEYAERCDAVISEFEAYKHDKEPYIAYLQLRNSEFNEYREDKEAYIAHLLRRIENRWWQTAGKLLIRALATGLRRCAAKCNEILWRLMPPGFREFWSCAVTEIETLRPRASAAVYRARGLKEFESALKVRRESDPHSCRVSLISTVFCEGESIGKWLESIYAQSHLPDEIVLVDAGSPDGTLAEIKAFRARTGLPIVIEVEPGANIARGRNRAVELAKYDILLCADAGCELHPDWVRNMLWPFIEKPDTEVAGGWTVARGRTLFQKILGSLLVLPGDFTDWEGYLPSSRTIAFRRQAWAMAGGYPEWLTLAGEDTFFAVELRNRCTSWAVCRDALVFWDMRDTWKKFWRQSRLYGLGDGEAGYNSLSYTRELRLLANTAAIIGALTFLAAALAFLLRTQSPFAVAGIALGAVMAVVLRLTMVASRYGVKARPTVGAGLNVVLLWMNIAARSFGFVQGVRQRGVVLKRRFRNIRGCCVVYSGVPLDDSGGGQRATQLTIELLKRGFQVVFLNQYPRYESVDLNIRIEHRNLICMPAPAFHADSFATALPDGLPCFAIAEFPHPVFLSGMRRLQRHGFQLVYDLIDDWRSSLGGDWYSIETEEKFVMECDIFLASARTLEARLKGMGAENVIYLPNAVNQDLFVQKSYPRPADMPRGKRTITYIGATWGSWFDWEILRATAADHPEDAVIIIGDYHGQCPDPLDNMHFLGLKRQTDLPAYLYHSNVAIIPFRISELTQAVSPLKVFEYLSMGLPVVATPMIELKGLPQVSFGQDAKSFSLAVSQALARPLDLSWVDNFRAQNSWTARVDELLSGLAMQSEPIPCFPDMLAAGA
jgi:GT2 family glycosyltransferase/glycosyltransferase involved in cell wall biosynthesis